MTEERLLQSGARPGRSRVGMRAAAVLAVAAITSASPLAAQAQQDLLDGNVDVLTQWVEARKNLASTRADWMSDKARLTDMISVRKAQLAQLNEAIEQAQQEGDVAEKERTDLASNLDDMKSVESHVFDQVKEAEARMRDLLPQLPLPLRQELQPLIARLPDPSGKKESSLSVSQRMQTVVGMLSQIEKYNDTVDLNQEGREIDGNRVQVQTLYFGLAQAYWVDGQGLVGGTGTPGPDGWVWTRDDSLAPKIQGMIAMYQKDTTDIKYVELPAQVGK